MEMHLVHIAENDEIAVLGFIFSTDQKYQKKPTLKLSNSRMHLVLSPKRKKKGSMVMEHVNTLKTCQNLRKSQMMKKNNNKYKLMKLPTLRLILKLMMNLKMNRIRKMEIKKMKMRKIRIRKKRKMIFWLNFGMNYL